MAQTGSLFSADAWNNVTFTAGEVKDPRRNLPLSLALGTGIVITLYLLANVAYIVTLPLEAIQHAPSDRVATATLDAILPGLGATLMAAAIMISTFGCNNGLILAGRAGLLRDGARRPVLQARRALERREGAGGRSGAARRLGRRAGVAAHLRHRDRQVRQPVRQPARLRDLGGADLLHPDHRRRVPSAPHAPNADRPYRAFGYPVVPALYMLGAAPFSSCSSRTAPSTTWPGLLIVLLGLPVYYAWHGREEGT